MVKGNNCEEKSSSFRLVAGAWCLAAFVLVQAYSGTLTSFILSPNQSPVISSIWDIPSAKLKISTYRGLGFDVLITKVINFSRVSTRLIETLTLK